jgi:hypothetical protein
MLQSALGRSRQSDKNFKQPPFAANWQALQPGQGDLAAQALKGTFADLTEQILHSYKTCAERSYGQGSSGDKEFAAAGALVGSFAFDLAGKTSIFLSNVRGKASHKKNVDELSRKAVSTLIEQSFDLLRAYAWEFNGFLAYPELHVTATKPAEVTEVLRYSIFREPLTTTSKLRARLSTRFYSLILRGQQNSVEFILMPACKVIGLTGAENVYEPMAAFSPVIDESSVYWQVEGQLLSNDRLEAICRRAFSNLIEMSKEAAG